MQPKLASTSMERRENNKEHDKYAMTQHEAYAPVGSSSAIVDPPAIGSLPVIKTYKPTKKSNGGHNR